MRRVALVAALLLYGGVAWGQEPPEAYPAPPEAYPAPPTQTPQPGYPPQPGYSPIQPPGMMPAPPVPRRPSNRETQNITVYGDLLGKGLLYGVGMDVNFNKWLGIGGTLSYYRIEDFQAGVVAPYLALYAGGHSSAFVTQAGPVMLFGMDSDWWIFQGDSTLVLGQVSLGYEYRDGFLFRVMMTFFFNENGVAPWPGFTFGAAF